MTSALAAIAASAAVAATTATAAIPSASTAIAASPATGWASLPRPGLIHGQRPAFNGLAVEFRNGILSVLLRAHRDKSKATRLAGEFILHESDFLHGTSLCEKLLQFVFRRVEGKIAYV